MNGNFFLFVYWYIIGLLFQGTTYKRIQPNLEINSTERDKFWAAEEEKEKLRQDEEREKKEKEQKTIESERLVREVRYYKYILIHIQPKYNFLQDADRIRRDSVINEEIPKTKPESTVIVAEPEEDKIEIAKPVLVTEEPDNQNGHINVEDDFGIRAEALYDYQAGNLPIKI